MNRQGGLGVAPRHLDVGAPEAALAVRFDPPEDRGQDEHLPGLQNNHLAGQWAFDVGQSLNEGAQVVRWAVGPAIAVKQFRIELVETALALEADQVIELAFAGFLDPLAGQDLMRDNALSILFGARSVCAHPVSLWVNPRCPPRDRAPRPGVRLEWRCASEMPG